MKDRSQTHPSPSGIPSPISLVIAIKPLLHTSDDSKLTTKAASLSIALIGIPFLDLVLFQGSYSHCRPEFVGMEDLTPLRFLDNKNSP